MQFPGRERKLYPAQELPGAGRVDHAGREIPKRAPVIGNAHNVAAKGQIACLKLETVRQSLQGGPARRVMACRGVAEHPQDADQAFHREPLMRRCKTTYKRMRGKPVQAWGEGGFQRRPPVQFCQGDVACPIQDQQHVLHEWPAGGGRKGRVAPQLTADMMLPPSRSASEDDAPAEGVVPSLSSEPETAWFFCTASRMSA